MTELGLYLNPFWCGVIVGALTMLVLVVAVVVLAATAHSAKKKQQG